MSSSDPDGPFFLPLRGGAGQARAAEAPGRTVRGMGTLTLTRAGKSRDGEWSTDDYDVFEGSRLIGHIVLTIQGPQGVPWFWEITVRIAGTR